VRRWVLHHFSISASPIHSPSGPTIRITLTCICGIRSPARCKAASLDSNISERGLSGRLMVHSFHDTDDILPLAVGSETLCRHEVFVAIGGSRPNYLISLVSAEGLEPSTP
jgi:hypothetical protein